MKFLVILIFTCVLLNSFSQKCNCLKAVKFIEKEYELNLASYQDQVDNEFQLKKYSTFKQNINQKAEKINDNRNCIGLISKYLSFFKDEHLFIIYKDSFYPFKSAEDSLLISKTFENEPKIIEKKNEMPKDAIEGIWYFQDDTFSINIFLDSNSNRQFAGVMNNNLPPFWLKNQLKLDITKKSKEEYDCIYWKNNRQPKFYEVKLTDSILTFGNQYKFYRNINKANYSKSVLTDKFQFMKLSDKTCYLRIPTFDDTNTIIDSILNINNLTIKSSTNLIIDIRNNGGGGDYSYYPLLPYIFNEKIVNNPISASIWVSKNNFEGYKNATFEGVITKEDSIKSINFINELKKNIGRFEPVAFYNDTLDSVTLFPPKIALITNRWCASTTEGFTLLAKQSSKVKQYGGNTGGMMSYGEWREIDIPNLPISVTCTQKKMNFIGGKKYEKIGISPDVILDPKNENDWINLTLKDLEK